MLRQVPLSCPGHTRPVVQLHYSESTPSGYYLISASKGMLGASNDNYCFNKLQSSQSLILSFLKRIIFQWLTRRTR